MNGQNLNDRFDDPDYTDRDKNEPLVTSDAYDNKIPVLASLVEQTPLGVGTPAVDRVDETLVNDAPDANTFTYPAQSTTEHYQVEPITGDVPYSAPKVEPVLGQAQSGANLDLSTALLNREESEVLRSRWNEIQGKFVDEPRVAVQEADKLVTDVIEKITEIFTSTHETLDGQWNQGDDVSTEDLRKALQHYRSFFNRLVV